MTTYKHKAQKNPTNKTKVKHPYSNYLRSCVCAGGGHYEHVL